ALDQARVGAEDGDPALARRGVASEVGEAELGGERLLHPGQLPGLESEAIERGIELGRARRLVEVAADVRLDSGVDDPGERLAAGAAARVVPDRQRHRVLLIRRR